MQMYLLLPILWTGNCSNQRNQTLITVAVSDLQQIINVDYQFRIQLSSGDPCHCVTLESATNDIFGLDITREWRDSGSFWCSSSNSNLLCASKTENKTFYSKRLLPSGIISTLIGNTCHTERSTNEDQFEGVNICVESTFNSIVDTLTGLLPCPQDGNWISSLNCSVISGTGLINIGCTNSSNG